MSNNITLVIMAAGIGSRFGGGVKQLEPVGPNGELIIDYSIRDAIEAGCNKVVFVIRKDIEEDFKEIIGRRIENIVDVKYVFQSVDELPNGMKNIWGRTKPWGTGQAVLCVKDVVKEPFIVINADDYYGKEAFQSLYQYMTTEMHSDKERYGLCMAGFLLKNTLSENGGVTRGVCEVDAEGKLFCVHETYDIQYKDGVLCGANDAGEVVSLREDQVVSMNMWGMSPAILEVLETRFVDFLQNLGADALKKEYLLPRIVDKLLVEKKADVKVLETSDKWFGVTYKEDKPKVVAAIRELIRQGTYNE